MAKINVITPSNLGKGIKKNEISKKWEVDTTSIIGNTLTTNSEGNLEINPEAVKTELKKIPCQANIKQVSDSYTVNPKKDNVLLVQKGTITLGTDVLVGQQFTVVQTGTEDVVIASTGTLYAPYQGSKTLAGQNAVVTVLCVGSNEFRIFGQTKGA